MKGVLAAPGDYVHFKSQVPLHKIPIGSKQWRYYDFGPKTVPPLICLPGIAGTADVYYKQIMALSMKVETLSKDDLASRLILNVDATSVGSLLLSDQFITIMDGTGGSRSREKDEKEEDDRDGQSKDGGNSAESSSSGSDPLPLPPPESSESQSTCTSVDELLNKAVLTARRYDAAEAFAHHLVASCVGYVYICLNYGSDFRQMLM
ncbi:unnamed protein product [Linum tenue]|uniref:Uncharacterized protein n=1 Tax=Linum tenue TaxID=586396 RepID=A0AAV0Q0T5_9ROSI|nr:unnamed protein product [Linum tenue]